MEGLERQIYIYREREREGRGGICREGEEKEKRDGQGDIETTRKNKTHTFQQEFGVFLSVPPVPFHHIL